MDVHRLEVQARRDRELAEVLDQAVETLDLPDDDVRAVYQLGVIDRPPQQLRRPLDAAERVFDLVREAERDRAERRQPLRAATRRLESTLESQVAEHEDGTRDGAVAVVKRRARRCHHDVPPPRAQQPLPPPPAPPPSPPSSESSPPPASISSTISSKSSPASSPSSFPILRIQRAMLFGSFSSRSPSEEGSPRSSSRSSSERTRAKRDMRRAS